MGEILILVARIIAIIIAGGISATSATEKVARESGVDFATLWGSLPNKWK